MVLLLMVAIVTWIVAESIYYVANIDKKLGLAFIGILIFTVIFGLTFGWRLLG